MTHSDATDVMPYSDCDLPVVFDDCLQIERVYDMFVSGLRRLSEEHPSKYSFPLIVITRLLIGL